MRKKVIYKKNPYRIEIAIPPLLHEEVSKNKNKTYKKIKNIMNQIIKYFK